MTMHWRLLKTSTFFILLVGVKGYLQSEASFKGNSLDRYSLGQCRSDACECNSLYITHGHKCGLLMDNGEEDFIKCSSRLRCQTPMRHCCLVRDWLPCDVTCGGGVQKKIRRCVDTIKGLLFTCKAIITEETRACNTEDCPDEDCREVTPFINEFHYDNDGSDVNEFVEIAGSAGADLTKYSLVLYNGSGGKKYKEKPLGVLSNDGSSAIGFFVVSFTDSGIQNGNSDGFALVDDNDNVIQLLSYEGVFEATDGPASGMTSTDIGVAESSSTLEGTSLSLTGVGCRYSDFQWTGSSPSTEGAINTQQTSTDVGTNV